MELGNPADHNPRRRAMGARFVYCTNNGVTALMGVDWYSRIYENGEFDTSIEEGINWDSALDEGLRIFTFCNPRRLMRDPRQMRYFTGINDDVSPLLHLKGSGGNDKFYKTFYVPFSNGWDLMRSEEHCFAVSHTDVVEWFGIGAETSIL